VSGSSAATCATIAKISLPELGKRGYDRNMMLGSLCGAGTLGILIPPSIAMIVYAVAADVSIIRMFLAGIIPGIMLLLMFSGYIAYWAIMNPERTPAASIGMDWGQRVRSLGQLLPVLFLILFVFLSMVTGVATANEASAFGVLGSLIIAAIGGSLSMKSFVESLSGALRMTCMIMFILGASAFLTVAMGFTGIPTALSRWVVSLELSPYMLIGALTVVYLLLGAALDGVSMIVLTTSVVLPMVQAAGFDPIWFGVYIVIMIELAEITPPVGFNLFVLQSMSGQSMAKIARASLPFFIIMTVATAIVVVFPDIVTWLPIYVMGK
jgi:tripartite ATP-independent transporter DctM subunit